MRAGRHALPGNLLSADKVRGCSREATGFENIFRYCKTKIPQQLMVMIYLLSNMYHQFF
jgi:hypothetical protein